MIIITYNNKLLYRPNIRLTNYVYFLHFFSFFIDTGFFLHDYLQIFRVILIFSVIMEYYSQNAILIPVHRKHISNFDFQCVGYIYIYII